MSPRPRSGLFVAEGTSDEPLAAIVERLFLDRGHEVTLARPDFGLLANHVPKDVKSRVSAGITLLGASPDVVVVHRDANNAGEPARRREIEEAVRKVDPATLFVPIIPICMTEAWLLVDERAIRHVAGNPKGREHLDLPHVREIERIADPKAKLKDVLATASGAAGRRRDEANKRFNQRRRQLLERLDPHGPVAALMRGGLSSGRSTASQLCGLTTSRLEGAPDEVAPGRPGPGWHRTKRQT